MNIELAKKLVSELFDQGVSEYVVCPGGRNSPMVKVLGANSKLKVWYYFEERSAAFFAFGLARKNESPVAVVTTSGTAAAELLPAMIEAKYSGIPLVAITADRPAAYRGTGAPQAMNQLHLFGEHSAHFANWSQADCETLKVFADQPVHINIEFDEPLVDSDNFVIGLNQKPERPRSFFADDDFDQLVASDIEAFKNPFVILGPIEKNQQAKVKDWLNDRRLSFFAEAASGLRADPLNSLMVPKRLTETFDSVIRIGGVPTHRMWRDLESKFIEVPVFNFANLPYSGLSRGSKMHRLDSLFSLGPAVTFDQKLKRINPTVEDVHADTELGLIRDLSLVIPAGSMVFLGNSLCIREWDQMATKQDHSIVVNRGMNGIDGLIASFFGAVEESKQNWLLLGDLSALYDLPSLHFRSQFENATLRIVVINNGGGKIFSPMFKDPNFENRHHLEFSGVAKMFGWSYEKLTSMTLTNPLPKHCLIELNPTGPL